MKLTSIRKFAIFLALLVALTFSSFGSCALGDYIRTGPVVGPETTFIGIGRKGSGLHSVDAVEGDGGKLYQIQSRFKDVDEYRRGRCWVHIKSKGFMGVPNIFSGITNLFKGSFYEKQADGSYDKIDIDSLVFDCRKVD